LTKDQLPKEEEMKHMSEYVNKLEGYADLEVSIIRATKINKVLKAILKLEEIPKESEFKFKERSQSLLEKWNKILESAAPPVAFPAGANDTSSKAIANGTPKPDGKEDNPSPAAETSDVADTPAADVPPKDEAKNGSTPEPAEETAKVRRISILSLFYVLIQLSRFLRKMLHLLRLQRRLMILVVADSKTALTSPTDSIITILWL
jgi:hypothetical protein